MYFGKKNLTQSRDITGPLPDLQLSFGYLTTVKMKPKKLTKAKLKKQARIAKRKAWAKLSKELRKTHDRCEVCGSPFYLQCHHVLPKEKYPEFLLETRDIIICCPRCHKWSKWSFHRNPVWASEWLKINKPEQFQWILNNIG